MSCACNSCSKCHSCGCSGNNTTTPVSTCTTCSSTAPVATVSTCNTCSAAAPAATVSSCNSCAAPATATAAAETSNSLTIQPYTSSCPGSCLQLTSTGYACANAAGNNTFNCHRWCNFLCGGIAGTDTGVGCSCSS